MNCRQTSDHSYKTTTLPSLLAEVANGCTNCGLCVRECSFLQNHGTPKAIVYEYEALQDSSLTTTFACHLCGLCTAVCPQPIDPAKLFLAMRQEAFSHGNAEFGEHSALRSYENIGVSKRFTWYGLPENCSTIFFPGCSLSGTRAKTVQATFSYLQQQIPELGIVLDCCTKPSHDLGDNEHFTNMFTALKNNLLTHGVTTVLTACPNCYKVFSTYAPELRVESVYTTLNQLELPEQPQHSEYVTVHDPCVARFDESSQTAVRELLWKQGLTIREMPHSKKRTLCCGQGGGVGMLFPDSAAQWSHKRLAEAEQQRIVNYCASCTQVFAARTKSHHILDLLFQPEATLSGKVKGSKPPLTYLNRLKLKRQMKRSLPTAISFERQDNQGRETLTATIIKKSLLIIAVIAAIVAVHNSSASQWLEQDQLHSLISSYGLLAPLVYMLIYSVAPALLLPGLPLGIIGGILFGPVWGVIYTITSATIGACLAFLISRYLARDLIRRKLSSPRWQQLDQKVEDNGWKIVALTRLIPLFPFNLLNYAFGLTPIRFKNYALATFIFMLPGTIAFITFSSSLLELLHGRVSTELIIGLGLIVVMSLLPVLYRRRKIKDQQGRD